MLGDVGIARVQVAQVLGNHIDVVEEEAVPRVGRVFERLEKARVHEEASIEGQIFHGLDQVQDIVELLLHQERMHVQQEELEVSQSVSVWYDERCPIGRLAVGRSELAAHLQIIVLGEDGFQLVQPNLSFVDGVLEIFRNVEMVEWENLISRIKA